MAKLNITASAGSKEGDDEKGFTVPIFVSATNDAGIAATGYNSRHFDLQLLHPSLDREDRRLFQLDISSVKELGNGYYRVVCRNAAGAEFLSGRVILSLTMKKSLSGSLTDAGQTLVSFAL